MNTLEPIEQRKIKPLSQIFNEEAGITTLSATEPEDKPAARKVKSLEEIFNEEGGITALSATDEALAAPGEVYQFKINLHRMLRLPQT